MEPFESLVAWKSLQEANPHLKRCNLCPRWHTKATIFGAFEPMGTILVPQLGCVCGKTLKRIAHDHDSRSESDYSMQHETWPFTSLVPSPTPSFSLLASDKMLGVGLGTRLAHSPLRDTISEWVISLIPTSSGVWEQGQCVM